MLSTSAIDSQQVRWGKTPKSLIKYIMLNRGQTQRRNLLIINDLRNFRKKVVKIFGSLRNSPYLYYVIKIENMSSVLNVKFESEQQIKFLVKFLSNIFGCQVRPRGRHSDRKSVLGNRWYKGTQNDIPWRKAERVSFYLIRK